MIRSFLLLLLVFIYISGLGETGYSQQIAKKTILSLGREDIDLLIDLTYSDNFDIAEAAVYRLGQLKEKKAFDRLISIFLFSGPSIEKGFDAVILASIWSLGEIGDPRAVDPLINNYNRFTSVPYRTQIIRALPKITNTDTVFNFLESVLKSTDNNMIAFEVVDALEKLGRIEALKVLSMVYDSKKFELWVNKKIEKVMSKLGDNKGNKPEDKK